MLQRYKKNRTSASFLLTKCATFLIKCYWGTFSVPSRFGNSFLWSHLGLNQGPPDYESGATNQLSYRTPQNILSNSFAAAKVLQKMHIRKKNKEKSNFFLFLLQIYKYFGNFAHYLEEYAQRHIK